MNWQHSLARIGGNWMTVFFGSTMVFGGEILPDIDVILKASLLATGIAGISFGYELRRYGESKRKT